MTRERNGGKTTTTVKPEAKDPRGTAPAAQAHNPNAPADAQKSAPMPQAPEGGQRARKKLDEMVSVTVHTPFTLTLDHGAQVKYAAGVQDVPVDHADHWYAKHHLERNE